MYVSEICAEGIFVTFPWWLKNVKNRSKIALFSNVRHFEIWFLKKKTITSFWSKLSKLHKKDPLLHVATTFSLKQGETRTSHGPIPQEFDQFWPCWTSVYLIQNGYCRYPPHLVVLSHIWITKWKKKIGIKAYVYRFLSLGVKRWIRQVWCR